MRFKGLNRPGISPRARAVSLTCLFLAAVLLMARTGDAADSVRLLALGDSLTAGYGLPKEDAFTTKLARALLAKGYRVEVIEAGVSGDTTAGGLARLDWALADKPNAAIVALGGNDGLRGLEPAETRSNMDAILKKLSDRKIPAMVAGMRAPPNMGREFGAEFNAVFPEVAAKYSVLLYPFFLDGVAAERELNQPDGIHPNAAGVDVIVERMLPSVIKLINSAPGAQAKSRESR